MADAEKDDGFWNLPDSDYLKLSIGDWCAFQQKYCRLVETLRVAIATNGTGYMIADSELFPVRMTEVHADGRPVAEMKDFDRDLYVHILHGTPKSEIVNGLRRLANLIDENWEKIIGDGQCVFQVDQGVVNIGPEETAD